MIIDLFSSMFQSPLSAPFVVLVTALAALVVTRLSGFVIRRVIRRLAKRSAASSRGGSASAGLWRVRSSRIDGESGDIGEQRRRQRIDAASRMVSHLVSLVIWVVAGIVAFHLLDVDPAFFLSSAGFIGAGLAIGGQHKVNDYLTGLSVHFEDRYGVGDEIFADVGWATPVQGIVDHVGLFSTRVRDQRSTLHFPNHVLTSVRNLSQEAATSTLRIRVPDSADVDRAADMLRGLAGTDGLTDVVFVGDLAGHRHATGEVDVEIVTSRTLDDRERDRLVDRAERALSGR
ncbi:MAG TPA: mechanosensitive ion channel domain-containing protein [Ilumatobacter sp.]